MLHQARNIPRARHGVPLIADPPGIQYQGVQFVDACPMRGRINRYKISLREITGMPLIRRQRVPRLSRQRRQFAQV